MLFEAAEDWDHRIDAWDGIESQHGLLADIWSLGFVSVPDEKKKIRGCGPWNQKSSQAPLNQPVGATVSTNYSRKTVQEERQKKKYYFIFKYFGKNVGLQVGFLI